MTNSSFVKLQQITTKLLDAELPYGVQNTQLEALSQLFCRISGLDFNTHAHAQQQDTVLSNGVAISPYWAAFCINELKRTSFFLRGLRGAIQRAQQRFPGQQINVLYAGCGPFATLALPLCTVFSPSEVKFTLLDIHKESIQSAQKLVTALELALWITDYVVADATQYQFPDAQPLHIVVSETMKAKLEKEPQVPILLNLVPQLEEGGICVPENISLGLAFKESSGNDGISFNWIPLKSVFELKDHLYQRAEPNSLPEYLAVDTVEVSSCPPECRDIYLTTEVNVFEGLLLGTMDCSLTTPALLFDFAEYSLPFQLEARYLLGEFPRLELKKTTDKRQLTPVD